MFAKLIYHTQLKTLSLANNEISVIENVQQLTTLEKLNVSRNRLASLEGLAALQSLVELDVSFNSLQSVEARHLPPHLQVLNVGSNCIQHLQCFASLAHASNLTTLRIAGRPLPPLLSRHLPPYPLTQQESCPPPQKPIATHAILHHANRLQAIRAAPRSTIFPLRRKCCRRWLLLTMSLATLCGLAPLPHQPLPLHLLLSLHLLLLPLRLLYCWLQLSPFLFPKALSFLPYSR